MIQPLECPNCGGRLEITTLNATLTDCHFCNARLVFVGPHTLVIAKNPPPTEAKTYDLSPIFARAVLFIEMGDLDGALGAYQRTLSFSPDNTQALYGCLNIYKQKDDHPNTLRIYNEILRVKPQDTNALYGLAVLFKQTNDLDSAIASYQTILRLKPEDTSALAAMAVLYKQKGDLNAALAVYGEIDRIKNGD